MVASVDVPAATRIVVAGTPAPQGSKSAYQHPRTGKIVLVESSAGVKPWRAAVVAACRRARVPRLAGPVAVAITFYLPRPAGHYGTGRNAGRLRPSAPAYPAVKPDVDKLERATLDGLTTGKAYEDDARVVDLSSRKRYADPAAGIPVGAAIEVRGVDASG